MRDIARIQRLIRTKGREHLCLKRGALLLFFGDRPVPVQIIDRVIRRTQNLHSELLKKRARADPSGGEQAVCLLPDFESILRCQHIRDAEDSL